MNLPSLRLNWMKEGELSSPKKPEHNDTLPAHFILHV